MITFLFQWSVYWAIISLLNYESRRNNTNYSCGAWIWLRIWFGLEILSTDWIFDWTWRQNLDLIQIQYFWLDFGFFPTFGQVLDSGHKSRTEPPPSIPLPFRTRSHAHSWAACFAQFAMARISGIFVCGLLHWRRVRGVRCRKMGQFARTCSRDARARSPHTARRGAMHPRERMKGRRKEEGGTESKVSWQE